MSEPDPRQRMTAEMTRAQGMLDSMTRTADGAIAKANTVKVVDRPLSDEEVRRFEAAAKDQNAPESLRKLAEKVEKGEFTWQEIAEGKAFSDPEVVAAYAEAAQYVDTGSLEEVSRDIEEGSTPEEIAAARAPNTPQGPADQYADGRSRVDFDDEDGEDGEDGGFSVFENRFR